MLKLITKLIQYYKYSARETLSCMEQVKSFFLFTRINFKIRNTEKSHIFTSNLLRSKHGRSRNSLDPLAKEFKMCLCCHKDDLALRPMVAKCLWPFKKKENHNLFLYE